MTKGENDINGFGVLRYHSRYGKQIRRALICEQYHFHTFFLPLSYVLLQIPSSIIIVNLIMQATENDFINTPTRCLLECGDWKTFGPDVNELNPFDCQFGARKDIEERAPTLSSSVSPPTPPMTTRESDSNGDESSGSPPLSMSAALSQQKQPSKQQPKPTKKNAGRKRRIVFEGEEAEDERRKFLERNRVAAFKCRQKKKQWMQNLEKHSEEVSQRNRELHDLVTQLREESVYLRNQLIAHSDCDCTAVQAYLRRTSVQLALPHSQAEPHHAQVQQRSASPPQLPQLPQQQPARLMHPSASGPPAPLAVSAAPSMPPSTGLTPFLNTSLFEDSKPDYFSHHQQPTTASMV
ncbi:hypothetical protein BCR43DRAFT_486366 [Syncephalastrum racemosum]|uniref:BZIP domain-containing protein n=1 Tax=Syncephalastrum racemosum TaxID=13706 RepID=A0A1X2HP07_SYNRA|nr:hypothetical protein BCR43DRAFT_486366 [Syncephalastrum racemosum]